MKKYFFISLIITCALWIACNNNASTNKTTGSDTASADTVKNEPIKGSYSIDPAVFKDDDGKFYMYFGGIWGGQLQRWATGKFDPNGSKTDLKKDDEHAIAPRVVR